MTAISEQEARRLVQECFAAPYDERNLRQFTANLLPEAEQQTTPARSGDRIPARFRGHVESYKRIAKIRGDENIDVLAVELAHSSGLRNARTMQRQFVASYLNGARNGTLKDAALAAFYVGGEPDWRFSFIYKDYVFEDGEAKTKLSEPRRSSFMAGARELSHTAAAQLTDLLQSGEERSVAHIREAFSVERVTREFFGQYRSLYLELQATIQRNIDAVPEVKAAFPQEKAASVYAKRMLGQIVFLYFLQKKGWLGVAAGQPWGSGSHTFLQDLFKANQDKDFFNALLNPLFYEALATDRRSQDSIFPLLQLRIPFLNGGLFEPLYNYGWRHVPLAIPNEFFARLFAVFDRYNFTVREDEPLESEVAVDPEMLGKVFEGLLDVDERRESGTFYTPRHIVQYMCRESLVQYLDRAINLVMEYEDERSLLPGMGGKPEQGTLAGVQTAQKKIPVTRRRSILDISAIREFIRQDELIEEAADAAGNKKRSREYTPEGSRELPVSIKTHAWALDKALAQVKICDPAIGSGAFPVGMMHEIVRARQLLRQGAPEHFRQEPALTPYALKRNTIARSLYGVDKEPSAVDIAKLRLWLSLVVDENDFDNIQPLPNLDYKIMAGNSLDADRTNREENALMDRGNCDELMQLQREYFNLTDHEQKEALKGRIKALREKCGIGGKFDWYIDFANTAGAFDIIIGNPPYIQIQSMDKAVKALKPFYQTFESTGDIYCLFYEQGFNLLKKHGILAFITSNKWMRAAYGKKMRDFFLDNATPIQLIDFAGNRVFDSATVDVNIIILEKLKSQSPAAACIIKEKCRNNLSHYIERNAVFTRFETGRSWAILSPIEQSIKRKIEAAGKPLKEWDVKIYRGILTGCNEAFIINGAKKDELIAQDPRSAEIIRPVLRGRDIKRYGYNFADLYVLWVPWHYPYHLDKSITGASETAEAAFKLRYPAVYSHLLKFKDKLMARNQAETGIRYEWYALQRWGANYWEDFNKQKIAWPRLMRMSKSDTDTFPKFAIVDRNNYLLDSSCFIVGSSLTDLCNVLNSNYALYFYFNNVATLDNGGIQMRQQYLTDLPIPGCCIYNQDIYNCFGFDCVEIEYIEQYIEERKYLIKGNKH